MTILEAAVRRVGVVQGGRAVAVLVQWDTALQAMGDEWPEGIEAQVQAYADWWRVAERTGWNDLRRFRAAFPGEETPARLMAAARDVWDERRGVRGLGAVALPA